MIEAQRAGPFHALRQVWFGRQRQIARNGAACNRTRETVEGKPAVRPFRARGQFGRRLRGGVGQSRAEKTQ
jgi:hypothetical protein